VGDFSSITPLVRVGAFYAITHSRHQHSRRIVAWTGGTHARLFPHMQAHWPLCGESQFKHTHALEKQMTGVTQ